LCSYCYCHQRLASRRRRQFEILPCLLALKLIQRYKPTQAEANKIKFCEAESKQTLINAEALALTAACRLLAVRHWAVCPEFPQGTKISSLRWKQNFSRDDRVHRSQCLQVCEGRANRLVEIEGLT
jgi:hypothetical protein